MIRKKEYAEELKITDKQLAKYIRKYKNSTLMEDMKFRRVCESKEVIEEILRVILRDNKLRVIESIKQKTEEIPIFHGVILDCRCRLKTGELVNIEVQVASNDDAVRRMRYNEAMLTIENSPKSKTFKYKNIPNVILIMFCQFDIFNKRKAIYEIDRVVHGTNVKSDNGVREVYVNLKAKVSDKKLKSLFKIMTTVSEVDDERFPKLSERKVEVNDLYMGGDKNMAGLDLMMYRDGVKAGVKTGREEGRVAGREEGIVAGREEGLVAGREEGRREGKLNILIEMVKDKLVSVAEAAKRLGVTEKEFMAYVK